MDTRRRKFLQWGVSIGVTSLLPLAASRRWMRDPIRLRIGSSERLTKTPELRDQITKFAETLSSLSDGEIQITLDDPDLSLSDHELFSALQSETIDLGVFSPTLHQKNQPAALFFSALPMGLSAARKILWLTSDETNALWTELYRPTGFQPLFFGCGASSYGQVCKNPITRLEDLKGLKICSKADGRQEWFKASGLEPVSFGKLRGMRKALRLGQLDISEALQHSANYNFGIHHLGHYYQNSWLRSSYTYEILIPQKKWASLSPSIQKLIRESATQSGIQLHGQIVERESRFLEKIVKETGEIKTFPTDVIRYFEGHSDRLRDRIAATNSISREIHRAYLSFEARHA